MSRTKRINRKSKGMFVSQKSRKRNYVKVLPFLKRTNEKVTGMWNVQLFQVNIIFVNNSKPLYIRQCKVFLVTEFNCCLQREEKSLEKKKTINKSVSVYFDNCFVFAIQSESIFPAKLKAKRTGKYNLCQMVQSLFSNSHDIANLYTEQDR